MNEVVTPTTSPLNATIVEPTLANENETPPGKRKKLKKKGGDL
jgi:hypothetical protein